MKLVLTGGTGFIGRHLLPRLLRDGYEVDVLSRSKRPDQPGVRHFIWDGTAGLPPAESIDSADAIIHLVGEPIMQRWTPEIKRRIRASRVDATRRLVEALTTASKRPPVLISGSAVGYYGDRGEESLTEASGPGRDFLSELCVEWEAAAQLSAALGIRVVLVRTAPVLGQGGGALEAMLPPFKFGLGGKLASGKQWMSWIHIDDVVALLLHSVTNAEIRGPVNATSPNPVRNSEFTDRLAGILRRPALLRVPKFALQLRLGEVARYAIESQRVIPQRAVSSGFQFRFPDLEGALRDLLSRS